MGKLNIAHHKSYHPYRLDNVERVRRDEEEARQKEEGEEGRMMLADSEARLDRLRERAGLKSSGKAKEREKEDLDFLSRPSTSAAVTTSSLTGSSGHINFFEDLESQSLLLAATSKLKDKGKEREREEEKGVPLAPSAKDLRPWYAQRSGEAEAELAKGSESGGGGSGKGGSGKDEERSRWGTAEDRKMRDMASKTMHDPLTTITHQLSASSRTRAPPQPHPLSRSQPSRSRNGHMPPPSSNASAAAQSTSSSTPPSASEARIARESSERERARALIARKKAELAGSMTPSSVGGDLDGGYRDVFNRQEVEEAHRYRGRGTRDRGWDDERATRRERVG
ncbi:hypothetical protein CONPUDRAFT_133621 [Coniophora puteana RWD-64-598 SS2]|uniref:CBF1-interacting co-repressor CIR N-terminal domain-containing protein n=1 Tax=Coniophora puteana (strain RWD-64-598) TaxID=741705 RepID=A0A5M3N3V0_CONPW|nr:uncharacterized protein CONPUDRAFT_133621 [Coniophora puteana RWD-64-598 SS2]EIW85907.1 hypothetical protein CONPUDRAFT_133621 [Coniophora puteana RWD-64-598 SS2]